MGMKALGETTHKSSAQCNNMHRRLPDLGTVSLLSQYHERWRAPAIRTPGVDAGELEFDGRDKGPKIVSSFTPSALSRGPFSGTRQRRICIPDTSASERADLIGDESRDQGNVRRADAQTHARFDFAVKVRSAGHQEIMLAGQCGELCDVFC